MVSMNILCGVAVWLLAAAALVGCGARQARPVPVDSALDTALQCEHLQGEWAVNTARIVELTGERGRRIQNNVGFLILTPLMLDLSNTEKAESEALLARNRRLESLAQRQRDCTVGPFNGATG